MTDLAIVCPSCSTHIPARRAPLVKVTCQACGTRLEVNMDCAAPHADTPTGTEG